MCRLRSFLLALGWLASSGTRFRIDIGAKFGAKLHSHPQEEHHDRNVSLFMNQLSKAEKHEADIRFNSELTSVENSSPSPEDYLEDQGITQNASEDQSAPAAELSSSYEEEAPEFLKAMAEYMGADDGSEQTNLSQILHLANVFGDHFALLADKLGNNGSIADDEESSQDVANEQEHVIRLAARAAEFGDLFRQVKSLLSMTGNGTEPVAHAGELADVSEKLKALSEKGDFDFMKEMVEMQEEQSAKNSTRASPVDSDKEIDAFFNKIIDKLGEDESIEEAEKLQA